MYIVLYAYRNVNAPTEFLTLGTLPKPSIPRRDPMFIGRENEVEEITKLITNESTRLLNIWGSPGFGKTSTTVEAAHHLNESLGYRVYFLKLHYIHTVDKLLSKILGIFRSSIVDPTITHLDKVVNIFREISFPVILMFDNLDDLLTGETSSTAVRRLLDELLDSNDSIKIVFTTRGLLQTTRGQVEGFRDFRIRSLRLGSSLKFVRQLLPSFSESVVQRVVKISFHVPLAMKILASSLAEITEEDIVIEMLDEFNFSENILEQIDDHTNDCENKLEIIFESLFKRLTFNENQAFIVLTLFASAMISKHAALDIISKEMGSRSKGVLSLNALVKKALIDEDVSNEYYSIHPLIYSFAVNIAKQGDFEGVLSSSQIVFSEYYLGLFEKFNDDFLAGKSIDCPKLEDTMQHLWMVMLQVLRDSNKYSNMLSTLFRILSKSEIFFFLITMPHVASDEVSKIYDLAIEKSKTLPDNFFYFKLYVSKYFQGIAFSITVECVDVVDIPNSVRNKINQLSDGTAAKLSCYETIFDICNGYVNRGTVEIEKCLSSLQKSPDHILLKCMCFQILMVYYSSLNQTEKSREFRKMALEICAEIGNFNLFLADDCHHKTDNAGEPLFLFNYLFSRWSQKFLPAEIKRYICNSVCKQQQRKEAKECCSPDYFNQVIVYGDFLLAWLSNEAGQKVILNEKIDCLKKSLIEHQDSVDVTGEAFLSISQQNAKMTAFSAKRLLFFYDLKIALTNDKDSNIEACRNALDSSLQHFGERHEQTAKCYHNIGLAEYNLENYDSALSAFDHALQIMIDVGPGTDGVHILRDTYHEKGKTCKRLGEFEKAISCYEEALKLQRTNTDTEKSEEIAEIMFSMGLLQYACKDYTAALVTLKQVLEMRVSLFSEKRCPYRALVSTYLCVGNSHLCLGNDTEGSKYFEDALTILKSSIDGKYESEDILIEKCIVYIQVLHWKVDTNFKTELLDRCVPVIEKRERWFLPILYLTVGFNQLESGKIEAGLKFIQNALDLGLDVIQQAHALIRGMTVTSCNKVVLALIKTEKYKIAKKMIDIAFQVAQSVPNTEKPRYISDCHFLRGCIYMNEKSYDSAINSFHDALRHLSEASSEVIGNTPELTVRLNVATAHDYQGTYKDALHELFLIVENCLVKDDENKVNTYFFIAKISKKMKNKSLVLRNLQFAYDTCLIVLGEHHPKTRQCHAALFTEHLSQ